MGLPPNDGDCPRALQPLIGLRWVGGDTSQLGSLPVGGRLSAFLPFWESLDLDIWVRDTLRGGYLIPFISTPPLSMIPLITPVPRDPLKQELLRKEISNLLEKGAIEPLGAGDTTLGFFSHYFLAPKKDGSWRPILDLKRLNLYIRCEKFRMETLTSVLQAVQPGDWMISLDLKDAYLHVPIAPGHRKFLRFAFRDPQGVLMRYQWKVLPFGLSTAPRVFTKIVAPLAGHLHARGIPLYPYIDDMFLNKRLRPQVLVSRDQALVTFLRAGFIINLKKSTLIPTQDLVHLGGRILSSRGVVLPPAPRVQSLLEAAREFQIRDTLTARQFLSYTGLMTSCIPMIPLCLFRVRPLTMHLLDHYSPGVDSLQKPIPLREPVFQKALVFWTSVDSLSQGVLLGSAVNSHR